MRIQILGVFFLAALNTGAYAASNSAHVCGDTRLSGPDQTECRTQMDAARTEGERMQVQSNFEKLSAGVAAKASQKNAAKTTLRDTPTPHTNSSAAPSDSYPPAEAKPPIYPGEAPDPKTGKPPA